MKTYVIYIICAVLIFLLVQYVLYVLSNKMSFHPVKATHDDINNLKHKFKDRIEIGSFEGNDGRILWYALYNKYRKPLWSDKITFYCHGNGGWLGSVLNYSYMDIFSKYGSVFIFDYGGYGMSTGYPTEHGCYSDTKSAWYFITNNKGVQTDNVVMFGHSLGSSIAAYMTQYLHSIKQKIPKYVILSAPFYNFNYISTDLFPSFGWLNCNRFETNKYLKQVKELTTLIYIHSKDDEIIHRYHSYKLRKEADGVLFIVGGSHNDTVLTPDAINTIRNAYV